MLRRVKQMHLLGFKPAEMLQSLEAAMGRLVPVSEVMLTLEAIQEAWSALPEGRAVLRAEGELWDRSEMFRGDLLALYQDQLANARATMNGEYNHADGRPVISTKPAEVLGTAEKILKLERDSLVQKRETMRLLGAQVPGAVSEPLPLPEEADDFGEVIEIERTELV